MGKMTSANGDWSGGISQLNGQRGLKVHQLRTGKSMEKGLKENDTLPEAGIEIIVYGVKRFPLAVRVKRQPAGEFFHGSAEIAVQFIDKFSEGSNLVKKLGFTREQDLAEQVIESSDALAPGTLEILRNERGKVGSGTKMLGVFQHGAQ